MTQQFNPLFLATHTHTRDKFAFSIRFTPVHLFSLSFERDGQWKSWSSLSTSRTILSQCLWNFNFNTSLCFSLLSSHLFSLRFFRQTQQSPVSRVIFTFTWHANYFFSSRVICFSRENSSSLSDAQCNVRRCLERRQSRSGATEEAKIPVHAGNKQWYTHVSRNDEINGEKYNLTYLWHNHDCQC